LSEPTNVKARIVVGDGPFDKAATKALKAMHQSAAADGLVPVGAARLTRGSGKNTTVTASSKAAPSSEIDDSYARPLRARVDHVPGDDLVKTANAALKALRDKAFSDHKRLVGPTKVSYTLSKAGEEYVTASGKGVPLGGLVEAVSVALAAVDDLGDDAEAAEILRALKPLRGALKDELKGI
jgi:hypothetical protein